MMIPRKTSSLAAAVLLAALSLSACGDKDTDAGASKDATSSPSKASSDLTEAGFVSAVTAAQSKARTSHVAMDVGIGGQSIKAQGDVKIGTKAADTAMSMTMDMGSATGSLQMRLVDEVFYLNFGPMTQNKFARIDLADATSTVGQQYGQLLDQMDPSKQLEQFGEAMKSFEKKGSPQKLDGVDAQPYEIVLDTSKIASLSELPGDGASSLPETLTYTMFVGPDDLPRRIVADVSGSTVTVDYSKWGEAVDIKAPSAGEISEQDLGKLMSGELAG